MDAERSFVRASVARDASQPPTRDAEREHARCVAALTDDQRRMWDDADVYVTDYRCVCGALVPALEEATDDHARSCDALWAWANENRGE